MNHIRKRSSTSNVFRSTLRNSTTGQGLTGLTSASSGLIISTICDNEASATAYTVAGSTIESITTLGTFAAPTATKCRFKEVDATNHPGLYEFQFADARYAVASSRLLKITVSGATNLLAKEINIQLDATDNQDAVRNGLSALPNAAAEAAGGLHTIGTGAGQFQVNGSGAISNVVLTATTTTVTNQLTAAAIATGVWQDSTSGDFIVASSIGKCLYISNVVPGGTGGHFIAGTNAATAITGGLTTHFIGTVDVATTVTNAVSTTANATETAIKAKTDKMSFTLDPTSNDSVILSYVETMNPLSTNGSGYTAPPSAATIAETVRDVSNASPAANSLGAAVNTGAASAATAATQSTAGATSAATAATQSTAANTAIGTANTTLTAIKGASWGSGDNLHQIRVDVGNVSGGDGQVAADEDIPDLIAAYRGEEGRFDATSGGSAVTASRGKIKRLEPFLGTGDLTQPTDANCLVYDPTDDSIVSESGVAAFFNCPAGLTIDAQNYSIFLVCRLMTVRGSYTTSEQQYVFFTATEGNKCNLHYAAADGLISAYDGSFKQTDAIPPTTWASIVITSSAQGVLAYVNGKVSKVGPALTAGTDVLKTLLGNGAGPVFGPAQGKYKDLRHYSRALTATEAATLYNYATTRGVPATSPDLNIVFGHDSITFGYNGTLANSYTSRLADMRSHLGYCMAQGGMLIQTVAAEGTTRIAPLIDPAKTNLVIGMGGSNDLNFGGRTAAQVIADTNAWRDACDEVRADYTLEIGILSRALIATARAAVRADRLAAYPIATVLPYLWTDGNGHFYYDTTDDDTALLDVAHGGDGIHPPDGTSTTGYILMADRVNVIVGVMLGTMVASGAAPTAEENAAATVAALAGAISVDVLNPTDAEGNATIVTGDWYEDGVGKPSLTYTITGYTGPAVGSAVVKWYAIPKAVYERYGASAAEVTKTNGTASLSGSTLTLKVKLTATDTALFTHTSPPEQLKNYVTIVQMVIGGKILTEVIAAATVLKGAS